MTEYRIVCTRDRFDATSGKVHHHDGVCCWWGYSPKQLETFDKKAADKYLEMARIECPNFDALTQTTNSRFQQTNIRIQTREVTEWKDKEEE